MNDRPSFKALTMLYGVQLGSSPITYQVWQPSRLYVGEEGGVTVPEPFAREIERKK